jgi:hypothetical protein
VRKFPTRMDIEQMLKWDTAISLNPLNWRLRLEYAQWMDQIGLKELSNVQIWLCEKRKTPGPPCVLEAENSEATWFIEGKENTNWYFGEHSDHEKIREEWCLPKSIFKQLSDFIDPSNRRDGGYHNKFAKSWMTRRQAEDALLDILNLNPKSSGKKYRTIDDL